MTAPKNAPESDSGTDHLDTDSAQEHAETDSEVGADELATESDTETSGDDPLGFGDERMNPEELSTDGGADGDESDALDAEDDLDLLAPAVLKERLLAAESKAEQTFERLVRMQADIENQRKRAQKDVEKARKFALEGLCNDLLPVKDSLEMGLAAATGDDADLQKIVEGSELTLKMLSQAFEKYNISEVNPMDEKFDPEFHQAMSMQDAEGKETNTVVGVLQKGYTLNDRLLRPALVMVAK